MAAKPVTLRPELYHLAQLLVRIRCLQAALGELLGALEILCGFQKRQACGQHSWPLREVCWPYLI